MLLQSLAGGTVEELSFEGCHLDEEKAASVAGGLSELKGHLVKINGREIDCIWPSWLSSSGATIPIQWLRLVSSEKGHCCGN